MKFINAFFIFSLLLGAYAQAQVDQTTILDNPTRPRIEELIPIHDEYKTPFRIPHSADHINFPHYLNVVLRGMPDFIYTLEKAYPNATFAFLGRDTQLLSDVMDAFFISRGQPGRVVQIATSKPTLVGLSASEIVEYLKSAGLDLDNLSKDKPFIMVDTVSKGQAMNVGGVMRLVSGRQGRQILQAVYEYWVNALHNKPETLLKRFNFVGLQVSTFDNTDPSNDRNYRYISALDQIQEDNKDRMKSGLYGYDMIVPLIADNADKFNEAGYDHYTSAWHKKFEAPTYGNHGALVPTPGSLYPIEWRQSILWIQHQILEFVYSQRGRTLMESAAPQYGVSITPYAFACRDLFRIKKSN